MNTIAFVHVLCRTSLSHLFPNEIMPSCNTSITPVITVNVDIFACIHFSRHFFGGNFACIEICVLCVIDPLGYFFLKIEVHIFSPISKKRETGKNMCSAKISTFTVYTEISWGVPSAWQQTHFLGI